MTITPEMYAEALRRADNAERELAHYSERASTWQSRYTELHMLLAEVVSTSVEYGPSYRLRDRIRNYLDRQSIAKSGEQ
jgi:hypothetical protein